MTTVVLNAPGAVTQLDLRAPDLQPSQLLTFPTGLNEFGNDGIIAWGQRHVAGCGLGRSYVHYVTGIADPVDRPHRVEGEQRIATLLVAWRNRPDCGRGRRTDPVCAPAPSKRAALTANFGTSAA